MMIIRFACIWNGLNLFLCFYFFSDCKVTEPSALAKDPEGAKKLWEISEKLVGLENFEIKW